MPHNPLNPNEKAPPKKKFRFTKRFQFTPEGLASLRKKFRKRLRSARIIGQQGQ